MLDRPKCTTTPLWALIVHCTVYCIHHPMAGMVTKQCLASAVWLMLVGVGRHILYRLGMAYIVRLLLLCCCTHGTVRLSVVYAVCSWTCPFLGCALYVLRRLSFYVVWRALLRLSLLCCACRVLVRLFFFTAFVKCVQETVLFMLNVACANKTVTFMLCRHVVCSWDFLECCAWLAPMRLFLLSVLCTTCTRDTVPSTIVYGVCSWDYSIPFMCMPCTWYC